MWKSVIGWEEKENIHAIGVAFAEWKATVMHLEMLVSMRLFATGLNALKGKKKRMREIDFPNSYFIYSCYSPIWSNFLQTSL